MFKHCTLLALLLFSSSPSFSVPQIDTSTYQATIQSIEIIGSTHFDQETLLEHLQWTRAGGEYHPEQMDMDISLNLKGFLKEHGFIGCKTRWSTDNLSNGKVKVRIEISEGPQYRLGILAFKDVKTYSPDEIKALFDLRKGDLVNMRKIVLGLDRLKKMYADKGYLGWSYVPEYKMDAETNVMDFLFSIDEGKRFLTGIIGIVGCGDQEEEDQLRALIKIKSGEIFRQSDLEGSVSAINNNSRFQVMKEKGDIVYPDINKGVADVIIYVKPKD